MIILAFDPSYPPPPRRLPTSPVFNHRRMRVCSLFIIPSVFVLPLFFIPTMFFLPRCRSGGDATPCHGRTRLLRSISRGKNAARQSVTPEVIPGQGGSEASERLLHSVLHGSVRAAAQPSEGACTERIHAHTTRVCCLSPFFCPTIVLAHPVSVLVIRRVRFLRPLRRESLLFGSNIPTRGLLALFVPTTRIT